MKIVLEQVEDYGWLASIEQDGKQVYRSEFQLGAAAAFARAITSRQYSESVALPKTA